MRKQQISTKVPGIAKAMRAENAELKTKVTALTEEVHRLNAEVKDFSKKLLNSHSTESARIERLLKSL